MDTNFPCADIPIKCYLWLSTIGNWRTKYYYTDENNWIIDIDGTIISTKIEGNDQWPWKVRNIKKTK